MLVRKKFKIVVSDLHLGMDYRSDIAVDKGFCSLLQELKAESEERQREVELILNGDIFDFLQIPAVEQYDPNALYPLESYLDSSEMASIKRLNILAENQAEVFAALRDFIQLGPPKRRLTVIKGDHDVHLYWPGIKAALRNLLDASGQKSSLLLFAGEFINREEVYIEHGHQWAGKLSRYPDFIDPRNPNDFSQLYYPPSSQFLINLLHGETPYTWEINTIKPLTSLIWYALSTNFGRAISLFEQFLPPDSMAETMDFFYALQDDNTLSQRYANDVKFRRGFHYDLLHYLNLTVPPSNNGASYNIKNLLPSDPLTIGQAEQRHQQDLLRDAAKHIMQKHRPKIIIFGHTHFPTQESLSPGYVYINTGSWTHNFAMASVDNFQVIFNGAETPYPLVENRIPYARVDYDERGHPMIAQLLRSTSVGMPSPQEIAEAPPPVITKSPSNSWLASFFSL